MLVNDLLIHMLSAAPVAIFDLIGCAALGATIIAFVSECVATSTKAPLLDKFAQQLAHLALMALLVSVAAAVAGGAYLVYKMPDTLEWVILPTSPTVALAASMGFTLFCLAMYRSTWKNLRQRKGPHLYLGAMAVLGSLVSGYAGVVTARDFATRFLAETPAALPLKQLLAPAADSLMWPVLTASLFLCLCYGGGVGVYWLVLRRERDDFGRDYYNAALPRAAKWGLAGALGTLSSLAWIYFALPAALLAELLAYPLVCFAGGAVALLVLAMIGWGFLAATALPLRRKWLAMLCLDCLWPAHAVALGTYWLLATLS